MTILALFAAFGCLTFVVGYVTRALLSERGRMPDATLDRAMGLTTSDEPRATNHEFEVTP